MKENITEVDLKKGESKIWHGERALESERLAAQLLAREEFIDQKNDQIYHQTPARLSAPHPIINVEDHFA